MDVKTSANIRRIISRRCASQGIPVNGTFELTPRCNLRCRMCYVRLTPEQLAGIGREYTAAEWLQLAREAADAGLMFLLITGGEPTLRPDFPEIYEGLMKLGLSISINTNGTLIPPALRELWHRLPPAMVNVTLYGTCREDYAALCGNPEAFDAVVENLRWLQSEGILVHLNSTLVPINAPHWEELEAFARDMNLDLRLTTYCFPPVRRAEGQECEDYQRLSPEDAARYAVMDLYYRQGPEAIRQKLNQPDTPMHKDCSLDVGEPMQCTAGRSQFWITWDGQMAPCGMLEHPVTRPFEEGFAPAWEKLHRESLEIRLCPECSSCPDQSTCLNCAAVTFTETGRFEGKPEYMCRFSRAYRRFLEELAGTLG